MTVIETKAASIAFLGSAVGAVGAEVGLTGNALFGAVVTLGVALVSGFVAGGVAYGILKNQATAAHSRIDEINIQKATTKRELSERMSHIEEQHDARFARIDDKLDTMATGISDIRVLIEGSRPAPRASRKR